MLAWAGIGTWKEYKKEHLDITQDLYYKSLGIKKEYLALYQHYIFEALALPSVQQASDAKEISQIDFNIIEKIFSQAENEGLNSTALSVMLYQWVYADREDRRLHQSVWVNKVLHRERVDFFPSSQSILAAFNK